MILVEVLTREDCQHCARAKEILGRLSSEFQLQIREMEMDSAAGQALAIGGGLLFPPGILIDGQPFSHGRPSEGKLRREFQRLTDPV